MNQPIYVIQHLTIYTLKSSTMVSRDIHDMETELIFKLHFSNQLITFNIKYIQTWYAQYLQTDVLQVPL